VGGNTAQISSAPEPAGGTLSGHALNANIQGARGLFCAMIFFYHVINSALPAPAAVTAGPLHFALMSLSHSVELFFGISGIVIIGSLRRSRSAAAFLWNRSTRIFPVLWVTVVIFLAMNIAGGRPEGVPPMALIAALPANLLAMPPVVPVPLIHPAAWSLSYEFAFYLVCASGFALYALMGRWGYALPIAAAAPLLWIHTPALMFIPGVLVALNAVPPLARWAGARFSLLALVAFLAVWHTVIEIAATKKLTLLAFLTFADWRSLLMPLSLLLAYILFIGMSSGAGVLGRILRTPAMLWMGTISYSFYLWHPIAMAFVKLGLYKSGVVALAGNWSMPIFFALALPPSLALAWASQRVLEVRVTNWLRRRNAKPAAAAATEA
jgi:exopolysaccharide production protein ExoZ